MQPPETVSFATLLGGEPTRLVEWLYRRERTLVTLCVITIILGAGLYGAAMGCWRSPLQALFVAVKFPIIILLVTLGNALLNAMIAPLLGLSLGWRQSMLAVLISFAIASAILGAFSPLTAFMVWNVPALTPGIPRSGGSYQAIMLAHVAIIALAGSAANAHLLGLLRRLGGAAGAADRVLIAWLAGNLFLGSQLCWILRPFIGSPDLPVQFLRADAFSGNFYETVLHSFLKIIGL